MATGFQFAHLQWSGKSRSTKRGMTKASHGTQRGKGWSTADILAEAERKKGHCSHVENPQRATLIYGTPLDEVEAIADNWAKNQRVKVRLRDGTIVERKMRSDAPNLAAGVISMPSDRIDEWPAFRDKALKALQEKYGDRLVSAVEHLDESHPHIHFYLVPRMDEGFGAVHPGYAASRAARAQPDNLIRSAYNNAMTQWQDWVHEAISEPFGLARIGPKRARQSNDEWKASEAQRMLDLRAAQVAEQQALIAKQLADITRREGLIKSKEQDLAIDAQKQTALVAQQFIENVKVKGQLQRLIGENEKSLAAWAVKFSSYDAGCQEYLMLNEPQVAALYIDDVDDVDDVDDESNEAMNS